MKSLEIETGFQELEALIVKIKNQNSRFRLNPCLSVQEIECFEARHQLQLPYDYRRFLIEIGNGGSGPSLAGLLPFEPNNPYYQAEWAQPFIHPSNALVFAQQEIKSIHQIQRTSPKNIHSLCSDIDNLAAEMSERGYIELGDYGCGIYDFLVVKGEEYGHVWWSDDIGDVFPALDKSLFTYSDVKEPNPKRQYLLSAEYHYRESFLDYYLRYLRGIAQYGGA